MLPQKRFFAPKYVLFSGHMNITVSTEAVATEELCSEEIPYVPNQGQKDMMTKLLLVRVRQAFLLPRPESGVCEIPRFCAG